MARIKVTPANISTRLMQWVQGQNTIDELIFIGNDINQSEWQTRAWELGNVIIDFQPDAVNGYTKILYKEKL